MTDHSLRLPWGRDEIGMTLPADWQVDGVLSPQPQAPVPDAAAEVRRALVDSTGSPGLRELARPGARVAVVIDDGSRPTPISLILPTIIEELEAAGIRRAEITMVTALGLHRPMTGEEVGRRVGAGLLSTLSWINHDCDNAPQLVKLGVTLRGTPVVINRTVAEADLVISVGCIEPHIIAGFGGGYKNLVPGVAGRETIGRNHALNCSPATFAMTGRPAQDNPMRQDFEEAGAMLRPVVFIVNAILNGGLEVVRIVAGHPIAAHREGARISAGLNAVSIAGPADIVITDSHPMDQDFRQGMKALANAIHAVRRGGVLLTLVRAEEGLGVLGMARRRIQIGPAALRLLAPLLLPLVRRMKLRGMGEEERFFLYFTLQAIRRAKLLIYAPTIAPEIRANLSFVEFVDSVDAALDRAAALSGPKPTVLVFPQGGVTYPVIDGGAGGQRGRMVYL
jgi:nickel-dependent lactate racemase